MKTKEQVEVLKKNWLNDACWDIEETEGFEGYKQELKDFRLNQEREWRAREYNRLYNKAVSLGIDKLGDKDNETNLELVKYLESLEQRIQSLEHKTEV